jgi:diguanylate cyclase (GGDEF)-like protein
MFRLVIIAALLCLSQAGLASTPESIEQLLETANRVRSSNPQLLAESLDSLRAQVASLSPRQSSHLKYLEGYQAAFMGKSDKAIEHYKAVISDSPDNALAYRAGYSLVNLYSITRDWTEGMVQLEQTLEKGKEVADLGLHQEALVVAGAFYNQLGQYELALDYANQLAATNPEGRNLCMSHVILVESLLHLGRLEPDSPEITSKTQACLAENEPVMVNYIRTTLAQRHLEKGEFEKARDTLSDHLPEVESTRYERLIAEVYAALSQAELGIGEGEAAAEHARAALGFSGGFMLSKPTVQAYWTLKEYHKQQGDYLAALDYEEKHTEAEKGLLDDQSKKQLAFQLAQHQVLQKNQQIELLSKENNLLQLRGTLAQETAAKNRLVLYLVIFLALSLAFWGYFLKRNQRRLKVLAEYDGLTGLNNRRHFNESAEDLLGYCNGTKQWASLIMFDMDKFKRINDTYGHSAGDWVLQQAAEVVRSQGRQNDLVGRIGGEEFAILLPSCDLKEGQEFAEKCRQAIEHIDSSPIGQKLDISASFGVTDCQVSGYGLDKLMSDCDAALYKAKRAGRNRVVCVKDR